MAASSPVNAVDVFRQVVRLLAWLDRIEQRLLTLYAERLVAAAQFQPSQMLALNQQEEALQSELRQLKPKRAEVLKAAQRLGLKCPDLKSLLLALGAFANESGGISRHDLQTTTAWLRRVETLGRDLQRQVWTNWHVIQRGHRELLELRGMLAGQSKAAIATGAAGVAGRNQRGGGGVLLDAKV